MAEKEEAVEKPEVKRRMADGKYSTNEELRKAQLTDKEMRAE